MDELQRTSPARDDLCRSAPFTLTRATDEGSDGLTIEGYGAVFNSVTEINSWEGAFEEVIAPNAFKRSLRARTPRMQFDHGQHPLLGSLPLGRWTTAEEDERGLHLVGRLTDNWLVTPFRDAIRDGGVEGMSFRFAVVNDDWADKDGKKLREDELAELMYRGAGDRGPIRRTLREVKVSEAGPVVWPAYDDTAVGVRNRGTVVFDLARLREPAERRRIADLVAAAEAATRTGGPNIIPNAGNPIPPGAVPADPPAEAPQPEPQEPQQEPDPQPTAPPPDDHSARQADSEVTGHAPGEHSAPTNRPANPTERAALIRAEFRNRFNRLMAIPKPTQEGVDAT